jgi:hypothetical protein
MASNRLDKLVLEPRCIYQHLLLTKPFDARHFFYYLASIPCDEDLMTF